MICLSAMAAYSAVPGFQFVFDDRGQVLENSTLLHLSSIPQYFQHHVWSYRPGVEPSFYRPLFSAWLSLNYALFGLHPAGWHVALLALHLLVCFLTYRLVFVVFDNLDVAFIAALLFALHPVHVESVAWVSAATDPLAAIFLLGSFLAYRRGQGKPGWAGPSLTLVSVACFAGALLCKEAVLLFPLLLLMDSFLLTRRGRNAIRVLVSVAPYFLIVAGYCMVRIEVLGSFSRTATSLPLPVLLSTLPSVLFFYLGILLAPAGLSPYYDSPYVDKLDFIHFWMPLVVLAGGAALALLRIRRRPSSEEAAQNRKRCGFMLAWAAVLLVPALDFPALDAGEIAHDRYLYLPSIGLLAVAAFGIQQLATKWAMTRRAQALSLAGLALILGAGTAMQTRYWKSDLDLFQRGAAVAPENIKAQSNLAATYLELGNYDRGIALHQKILDTHPRHAESYFNIGMAYYNQGNLELARIHFQKAIELQPEPAWYFYLGLAQFKSGQPQAAEASFSNAIRGDPIRAEYHAALGAAYETEGRALLALREFELAAALNPEDARIRGEIAKVKRQLGPADAVSQPAGKTY